MLVQTLNFAHRLDMGIKAAAGRPYHVVLGIGLVLEIGDRMRELHEAPTTSINVIRMLAAVTFSLVLLIHQLGELSERVENRTVAGRIGRRRSGE